MAIHEQVLGILQLPMEVHHRNRIHVQLWLRSPNNEVNQTHFWTAFQN